MDLLKNTYLLCILFSSPIMAASFSCEKANTSIEKVICSNSELSKFDKQLASLYKPYNKSALFQKIQQDWLFNYRDMCEEVADDIEFSESLVQCLKDSYEQQIKFYQAVNSKNDGQQHYSLSVNKQIYSPKKTSGNWRVYTLATIPRYADMDGTLTSPEKGGIIDNAVLDAKFINKVLYAVIYAVEKYDGKKAVVNNMEIVLPWTASLYGYTSKAKQLNLMEENKRIHFMNESFFHDSDCKEQDGICKVEYYFYNNGDKAYGFKGNSFFYQYFKDDHLVKRVFSFITNHTNNTDIVISELPPHIKSFENRESLPVKVTAEVSPMDSFHKNYQLNMSYFDSHGSKKLQEKVFDDYPFGKDEFYSGFTIYSGVWSKSGPYFYVNFGLVVKEYKGSSDWQASLLKVNIEDKTVEQILPIYGHAYKPYPISLGSIEAILFIEGADLKIAINFCANVVNNF